jgi:small subunit ribosomal protein S16
MAVRIRLKRFGKKKQPFYRVVVAEKANPRDGKTLETLGTYDPRQTPVFFEVKEDRVNHWISVGAQPSDTVERLLANSGIGTKTERKSSNLGVSKKDRAPKAE